MINVLHAASTSVLVSSVNPALPGSNVTFTATVSAVPPGAGTPTGFVQFRIDGSPAGAPVALSSGSASYSTDTLTHGSHSVSAEYAGDGNFGGSTNSPALSQTIDQPPTAGAYLLGATQDTPANLLVAASCCKPPRIQTGMQWRWQA